VSFRCLTIQEFASEPEPERPEFVTEGDWAAYLFALNAAILHCRQSPAERSDKIARTDAESLADIVELWGALRDRLAELVAIVDEAKLAIEQRAWQ
jgi:hypothetical protein